MLIWFVVAYLIVSVGIGLFAATRVHSTKDFAVAGRSLPLPVVMATVGLHRCADASLLRAVVGNIYSYFGHERTLKPS